MHGNQADSGDLEYTVGHGKSGGRDDGNAKHEDWGPYDTWNHAHGTTFSPVLVGGKRSGVGKSCGRQLRWFCAPASGIWWPACN